MPVLARPGWDADASRVLSVPGARETDGEGRGRGRIVGGVKGGGEWEYKEGEQYQTHTHTHTKMDDGICGGQGEEDRRDTSTKIKMTINNKY